MIDYARIVWRARWLICAMVGLAPIVAFGIARSLPKIYTARATILIAKESAAPSFSASLGAMLAGGGGGREGSSGLSSMPSVALGLGAVSTDEFRLLAMLRSRRLQAEVFEEIAKTRGESIGSRVVSVKADSQEKGVIAVVVEATDPQAAADVANQYFVSLDAMLQRYSEQTVMRKEALYTSQLERAARGVEAAEQALLKFQAENRFIPIDAPAKASIEAVANLRTMILALEMQREVIRLRMTDEHPQVRELQKQISELKRQYSKNLFGEPMDLPPEGPGARGSRKEFFVAASRMTPVQFAFLKLFRDLKIQEAFYTAAVQGLQQIKYGDGLYQVAVQVLDRATPPGGPSRPNVRYIPGAAAVSALIAGILLAFAVEYVRQVRQNERQARTVNAEAAKRSDKGSEIPGRLASERLRRGEPGAGPVGRGRGMAREVTE